MFTFWMNMDRNGVNKKKSKGNNQPSWGNKKFITVYGFVNFFLTEQDSAILPAQVANYSAGFYSTCPLT